MTKPNKMNAALFRKQLPILGEELARLLDEAFAGMTEEQIEAGMTPGVTVGLHNPDGAMIQVSMTIAYITDEDVEEIRGKPN